VGHDFRFGRDRSGDASWLRDEGRGHGFEVHEFPPVMDGDRPFSSTRVRQALAAGNVAEAERLLGHTVLLEGIVGRGRGQGAKLLVATANLDLPREQFLPAHGVYAAWAETSAGLVRSVVNIGVRPTLVDDPRPVVEAHLIDWQGELRGTRLGLHFAARLRDERKFSSLNELREAVAGDIRAADTWLGAHPLPRPSLAPGPGDAGERAGAG
jgi:riboflavin kinase/FMN adenylyltransferase